MTNRPYSFEFTPIQKSIIKVIGVGGGGSNAVNFMFNQGIRDVDFVICNTDNQALQHSPVPVKLQIGESINKGLGAGGNPTKGKESALESKEQIKELLNDGTKMLFITAGMGGGTGSGAAPVIAQIARELGILTVGIVTLPFRFEGRNKMIIAEQSVKEMRAYCDAVIEISNDKIREMFSDLEFTQAFANADLILATAAKSISELITKPAYINVDFEDVKTVMANSGFAVMGSASASGKNRAMVAIEHALNSPLLNSHDIHGAQKILISIISGDEPRCSISEISDICDYVQNKAGYNADLKCGTSIDPDLGEHIRVTVIVTGFEVQQLATHMAEQGIKEQRTIIDLPCETSDTVANQPSHREVPQFNPNPQTPNTITPVFHKPESSMINREAAPSMQAGSSAEVRETPVANAGQPDPIVNANVAPTKPESKSYVDLSGQSLLSYSSPDDVERPLINIDQLLAENTSDNKNQSNSEKLRSISERIEFDADTIKRLEVPTFKRQRGEHQSFEIHKPNKLGRLVVNNENEIVYGNRFLNDRPD